MTTQRLHSLGRATLPYRGRWVLIGLLSGAGVLFAAAHLATANVATLLFALVLLVTSLAELGCRRRWHAFATFLVTLVSSFVYATAWIYLWIWLNGFLQAGGFL